MLDTQTQKRRSSTIPFGWRLSDDRPGLLVAVQDEQEALSEAIDFLRQGCSIRETARWLSADTGRYLSYNGLRKIYMQERT